MRCPRRMLAVVTLLLILATFQLNRSDELALPIQKTKHRRVHSEPIPRLKSEKQAFRNMAPPKHALGTGGTPVVLPARKPELSATNHKDTKESRGQQPGIHPWLKGSNQVYMWDELCDNTELCKERCALREPCISYDYKPNNECHLYRAHVNTYANITTRTTRSDKSLSVPAECAMNSRCSCPVSSRVTNPFTREKTCKLLKGKTLLFSGDSLVRDQWTTLGVWLAGLDMDIFDGRKVENHAACMINAWKFLSYIGTEKRMRSRGLYTNNRGQLPKFTVCSGATTLLFDSTNKFTDIQNHFSHNSKLFGVGIWIIGGGVHQMVNFGDDETQVHSFIKWLDKRVSGLRFANPIKAVYIGTHHRIIELAPKPYRAYAQGPQGNKKIQRWNRLFCLELKSVMCVDPYWITQSLDHSHPDTEDGMHMGFWVNLQKVQMLLQALE